MRLPAIVLLHGFCIALVVEGCATMARAAKQKYVRVRIRDFHFGNRYHPGRVLYRYLPGQDEIVVVGVHEDRIGGETMTDIGIDDVRKR